MEIHEIPARPNNRHRFTVSERLALLAQWEKCVEVGEKSAFARRAGVSPHSLSRWSRAKREGLLVASDSKQTNYAMNKRERIDYVRLQRQNAQLKKQLEVERNAVEVLGKASELLASLAKSSQSRIQTPPELEQPEIPPAFGRLPREE